MAASVYAGGRRVADMMIDEAKAWSKKKDHVVWIGMHEPGKELLERVADQLHLHPLAIEDASNAHQQPKVEQYGDALFVVARTAQMADGHIDFGETHLFVGEGMMAAQLIACHNASMECYRRSMIGEHGNRRSLSNIHVHEGGQAIVGNVEGVGCEPNRRINPMLLDMHRAKRCGAKTRSGKPCLSPAMANGRCRMHGGPSPGAPTGNKNAFKHGRYTREVIAWRREISRLIRAARALGGKAAV